MSEAGQTTEADEYVRERAVQHVAELWVQMGKTEAFQLLLTELERMGTRYRQLRFDSIMRGEAIDQREVDYERGLISGLQRPALILQTAENAILKSERLAEEVEATAAEEEVKFW